MEQKDNLLGIIQTLWNWRIPILVICLAAGIGSIIVSLLMPNHFKATTLFLAASPDQAKPELLFGWGVGETEYYGNKNDIDRLLTISESYELVDFLVDSFNLYEHYDIDIDHPKAPFLVQRKFFKLYEVTKTKRDALELTIEDRDPALAAKIANTAREKINEIAQRLLKDTQFRTIKTFEDNINSKQNILNELGDSLFQFRLRYGIYFSEDQAEGVLDQQSKAEAKLIRNRTRLEILKSTPGIPRDTISYLNALVKGMDKEVDNFNTKVKLFNEGMTLIDVYRKQWQEANQSLSLDKERVKQFNATFNANIPATLLVEEAQIPIIKSRPHRTLIVLGTTAIAFFFSILAILLLETYKEMDWRRILSSK